MLTTTAFVPILVIVAAACAGATPSAARPAPDAAHTVGELQRAWVAALQRGDVAAIEEILAPDFINTAANGKVLPRTEELAPVRAGTVKFTKAELDDLRVRVFGDVAVATGIGIFEGSFGDRGFSGRERFTDVWVQRSGRWQVVASHNSLLRD
jgi:ketosteroid isomerase-like protein